MFLLDSVIFPWDLAILLLLSASAALCIAAIMWILQHRTSSIIKRLAVGFFGIVGLFVFLVVTYGSFIEPHLIIATEHDISLPLKKPLTIAVLSDLHVGPYKKAAFVERAVAETNRHFPDLVLLTGDFVMDGRGSLEDLRPLAKLHAPLGVFAVLGNHDMGRFLSLMRTPYAERANPDGVAAALEGMGITVLRNEHRLLQLPVDTIAVAGIDDLWSGSGSIDRALAGIGTGTTVILLSHNPDVVRDARSRRAHLIVSGHTHGGQIRLPFFGPVPQLPTHLGKVFDQGIFTITPTTTLAITRGLGETLARARLLAPPEVMVLNVHP